MPKTESKIKGGRGGTRGCVTLISLLLVLAALRNRTGTPGIDPIECLKASSGALTRSSGVISEDLHALQNGRMSDWHASDANHAGSKVILKLLGVV